MAKKVRKTMRFRYLKRDLSLFICLLGAILFFLVGCHTKKPKKSEVKKPIAIEDVKVIKVPEQALKSREEFRKFLKNSNITGITTMPPQKVVKQMKEYVINVLPFASDKNKEKLNGIIKHLDSIKNPSEYFDDENSIIDFGQSLMQLVVIAAEIEPDNFDINHQVGFHYFNIGNTIKSLSQSEEHELISAEYKEKGFQAAKKLVERFPNEAEAYHQRAYFAYHIEGDKKKASKLFKRCLELNPELEFCQKGYDNMLEELNK